MTVFCTRRVNGSYFDVVFLMCICVRLSRAISFSAIDSHVSCASCVFVSFRGARRSRSVISIGSSVPACIVLKILARGSCIDTSPGIRAACDVRFGTGQSSHQRNNDKVLPST